MVTSWVRSGELDFRESWRDEDFGVSMLAGLVVIWDLRTF